MLPPRAKNSLLFLLSIFIAVGLNPLAVLLERPIHPLLSQPLEFGAIALTEETLKSGLSLILYYFGAPATVPIAVGLGFGGWEMLTFVHGGVPVLSRIGALGFHILTGIVLWWALKKKRPLWIGAALVVNILLHWWWNLQVILK